MSTIFLLQRKGTLTLTLTLTLKSLKNTISLFFFIIQIVTSCFYYTKVFKAALQDFVLIQD